MWQITVHERIDELAAADWNRLVGDDAPFMRHEFLAALEHSDCVGERYGWIPRHLALRDREGRLRAAVPCYLKWNSYGEFVFDWAWAEAYRRAGQRYYPKLVVAVPYTPATGRRLLTGADPQRAELARALIAGVLQRAAAEKVSGVHFLFTSAEETAWLAEYGLLPRLGYQFHWHRQGETDMTALLARFTAEKRKKIKRERRRVREAGIVVRRLRGDQVSAAQWEEFHRMYTSTFDKHGGIATLSLAFFTEIAARMGHNLLLVLAEYQNTFIAAAFNLVGARTLYGRYWGCLREFHSLHFETCYYQGLEYCLAENLLRFEPGAQGEHKLSRGFVPTPTWSAHGLTDPAWRAPLAAFLNRERAALRAYCTALHQHSPYKATFAS